MVHRYRDGWACCRCGVLNVNSGCKGCVIIQVFIDRDGVLTPAPFSFEITTKASPVPALLVTTSCTAEPIEGPFVGLDTLSVDHVVFAVVIALPEMSPLVLVNVPGLLAL